MVGQSCGICSICIKELKLTLKTAERRQWRRTAVFFINFQHVFYFFHVLLLILSICFFAGYMCSWKIFLLLSDCKLSIKNCNSSVVLGISQIFTSVLSRTPAIGSFCNKLILISYEKMSLLPKRSVGKLLK